MSISLKKAIELIIGNISSVNKTKEVHLEESFGKVLSQDILAKYMQPPFNRSPLDGYALFHTDTKGATKDTPVTLEVIDKIYAGESKDVTYSEKTAVRIMTGAKIPDGFDCILKQEETNYGEDFVEIYKELSKDDNVCFMGEDVKIGDKILEKNTRIKSQHIGVLAGQGKRYVEVYEKPKILLITTGDEVCDIDEKLGCGKIYNTNYYTLKARLEELFAFVIGVQIGDDIKSVCDAIKEHDYDAVITTGGVSVGQKDIMHDVVESLGEKPVFWKVDIQPGTPVLFWKYNEKPVLSLSGNPFAMFAIFELLGVPMVKKLRNLPFDSTFVDAIMQDDFLKKSPRRRFIRAFFENGKVYLNTNKHSSGSFSSTVLCNCLVEIKAGTDEVLCGENVRVLLF